MRTFTKTLISAAMTAMLVSTAFAALPYDNPPGPAGGPGTDWPNAPCQGAGPGGGPGPGPDVRAHHRWLRQQMTQAEWRHFMAMKMQQRQQFCINKRIDRARCWFDANDMPRGPGGCPGPNAGNPPGPAGGPGPYLGPGPR